MKKWHKILLVVVGFWLTLMVVLSPRLVQAWRQKKAADRVFSEYTQALIDQRWGDAYALSNDDFRVRTSSQAFASQHQELVQKFGKLQSVRQGHTVVEGGGTPPDWTAEIHADLRYESRTVALVYWLRPSGGQWKLVGYRLEN